MEDINSNLNIRNDRMLEESVTSILQDSDNMIKRDMMMSSDSHADVTVDENLIITSYWEICELTTEEINAKLRKKSSSEYSLDNFKNDDAEKELFIAPIESATSIVYNSENKIKHDAKIQCDFQSDNTLRIKSTVIPSKMFNFAKLPNSVKENLDKHYLYFFDKGMEMHEFDVNQIKCEPQYRQLFHCWCWYAHKRAIVQRTIFVK